MELVLSEINIIKEFVRDQQVEAYRIYKDNQLLELKVEKAHEEKMEGISRTSKVILKVVGILSAFTGALTVLLEVLVL